MNLANRLKFDIFNILFNTNDLNILKDIHHRLSKEKKLSQPVEDLPFAEAITTVREDVSLEQMMKEQNYKPITYEEFRKKADEIEWEESLEELLNAIK